MGTAAARKSRARQEKSRATPQASLGLTIDPRRLSRSGILELMRIAAGLSYKDVSRLTGIPRAKAIRLIRGAYQKPRRRDIEAVRDVCWARMPARSPAALIAGAPSFLTLEEAADLMAVGPAVMRRLVGRNRALRAIKVGIRIRIPQDALASHISALQPEAPAVASADGLSRNELAAILRVPAQVLRRASEDGRIKEVRRWKHGRPRIPRREVKRILAKGTHELPRSRRHR